MSLEHFRQWVQTELDAAIVTAGQIEDADPMRDAVEQTMVLMSGTLEVLDVYQRTEGHGK